MKRIVLLALALFVLCLLITLSIFSPQTLYGGPVVRFSHRLALFQDYWYKGGLGTVKRGLFIQRENPNNEILFESTSAWRGRSIHDVEIVAISNDHPPVIKPATLDEMKTRHGTYVVFSPDYIYILDFDNSSYGKYPRP